jgi:hypothetical protein
LVVEQLGLELQLVVELVVGLVVELVVAELVEELVVELVEGLEEVEVEDNNRSCWQHHLVLEAQSKYMFRFG